MNVPISRGNLPFDRSDQGRMADTPHTIGAPLQGFRSLSGMKQSSRYGILLFLLQSPEHELSEGQRLWIVYRSRKFSLAELLKAGKLSESLLTNEVQRKRMQKEISETHHRVPSLNPKQLPEKRRIGIGYRDKGALRPLHHRRIIGERTFWDQDLLYLLPLDYEVKGKWLTADEVDSLVGVDLLNLVLLKIQEQYSVQVPSIQSVKNLKSVE